jgi:glycosyltransferase involved in cell wall biosynthesis
MKVLHVIPAVSPKYGGPSQALLTLCQTLQAGGVEVQIASTDGEPGGRMAVELETPTTHKGVPAIFFRLEGKRSFTYSSRLARWLEKNVSAFDVVYIHGVFSQACLAAAKSCQRQGIPYVVRPLGHIEPWSLAQKPFRKKLFLRLGGTRMLRHAAAVHYASAREKELSEAALRLNHGVVIPLGIDFDLTVKTSFGEQNGARRASPRPYVLVLSRLQPTKGIDVLLEAFLDARTDERLANWQLMIAGDGSPSYVAALKRIVKERNAGDAVMLTGWLDGEAKSRALAGASLLALPSHHESFGLCVVEAMALGIAVLVSPQVGIAPEVNAAGAGWLSAVEAKGLAETLRLALGNDDERRRRGAAGRLLVRTFSSHNVVEMLTQISDAAKQGAT